MTGTGRIRRGRVARTALLVVAAFLATMAVLLRTLVYPGALVLPLEQDRIHHLTDRAASYLDPATLTVRRGVPVTATATLLGDPGAGDERTAVWVEFFSVETEYGQRIDYHERRTAFDRRTGMIVDCCESYVDDVPGARQSGLAFRLPFAAAKRDYPIYDPVLRRQVTLRFSGEDTVAGLPVYRYTATAGPVKVEDLPDVYTAEALGLDDEDKDRKKAGRKHAAETTKKKGSGSGAASGGRAGEASADGFVPVSRYVAVTRTLWVEPESGLPVQVRERRRDTLRTADGVDRLIAFEADLTSDPLDVELLAAEAKAFRDRVVLVRDVLPPVLLAVAPLAALAAWWAGRRRGGSPAAQDEQQVPGHDLAETR